jgi:hypothetical protein
MLASGPAGPDEAQLDLPLIDLEPGSDLYHTYKDTCWPPGLKRTAENCPTILLLAGVARGIFLRGSVRAEICQGRNSPRPVNHCNTVAL